MSDIEAIKRAMESGSRRLVAPKVLPQTGTDRLQTPGLCHHNAARTREAERKLRKHKEK